MDRLDQSAPEEGSRGTVNQIPLVADEEGPRDSDIAVRLSARGISVLNERDRGALRVAVNDTVI